MNPSCLKHTVIPGTSRLFLDYLYHFDRVRGYFDWNPFDIGSFQDAARQLSYPPERREALVEALRAQNPGSDLIDKLAKNETLAVVTGQQVGLFSGPAYTIYKAITAVRLTERLTSQGIPAVAIFWLATEDHDTAEVDHAWVFNSAGTPLKLGAKLEGTSGGPVGEAVLKDIPLDQLGEALEGFPYADDVLSVVRRAYVPGMRLGDAFRAVLKELLRDQPILFLDPLDPAIRRIAAPFLAEAVDRAREVMDAVLKRSAELASAGYHAQVHVDAQVSPVFLLENGRRVAFKLRDGQFMNGRASHSRDELMSRPTDVSPNALLRPVMQDFLLPTVAYVGGPAEIAYMAQAQVVYRMLLGRMPVIVPRNGFTLLDTRAAKLMERYRLQVQDLLQYEELVRERIAERLVPPDLHLGMAEARQNVEAELSRLAARLAAFDPTLSAAAGKSAAKIRYQLEKLSRKIGRESMRRNERAAHDAEYLMNRIYPHGHLQERLYTILPFVAEHGLTLIGRLVEASGFECPDHLVRAVSELPQLPGIAGADVWTRSLTREEMR